MTLSDYVPPSQQSSAVLNVNVVANQEPLLQRSDSILDRGRASEVRERRRQRALLSREQKAIAVWVWPILTLVTVFIAICSIKVFGADTHQINSLPGNETTLVAASWAL